MHIDEVDDGITLMQCGRVINIVDNDVEAYGEMDDYEEKILMEMWTVLIIISSRDFDWHALHHSLYPMVGWY